jgi:hypothetical protein
VWHNVKRLVNNNGLMVSRSDKRDVFRVTQPYSRGVNIIKMGSDRSLIRMIKIKCEQSVHLNAEPTLSTCIDKVYCIIFLKKSPTNAVDCTTVILLHRNHRYVPAVHVVRTGTQLQLMCRINARNMAHNRSNVYCILVRSHTFEQVL